MIQIRKLTKENKNNKVNMKFIPKCEILQICEAVVCYPHGITLQFHVIDRTVQTFISSGFQMRDSQAPSVQSRFRSIGLPYVSAFEKTPAEHFLTHPNQYKGQLLLSSTLWNESFQRLLRMICSKLWPCNVCMEL